MSLRRFTSLAGRLVLGRRTARRRLTVLYVALFLASGVLLLGITGVLAVRSSSHVAAARPGPAGPQNALSQADTRIQQLQLQLANQSAQAHGAASHQVLINSLIGLAVLAVLSVVLGLLVAGRVLRPLRDMTDTTRRISADNLNQRLAMPGPRDELKDLADTIDGLLERLEGSFAAQRRFVANASHELRTPLATMRASLDVAEAKPGPVPPQTLALTGRLRAELNQVDELLEGLLVLARAQHGALASRDTLALDNVVAAALASRSADVAARHLTVRHDAGPDAAWVHGSPALLRRMVDNLVDNAITHNADGGWILVSTGSQEQTARLVVQTGGPVLDQRHVDQLAQPFRRLGADRTGSDSGAGLGLSIVAAIVSAHGGTLDLHARPEGGLQVSVALPVPARAGVPA